MGAHSRHLFRSRALTMLEGYSARITGPFAVLGVRTEGERLVQIDYLPLGAATLEPVDSLSREVCAQLQAYFDDPDFRFDLPFRYDGSAFQCRVWELIRSIPRGHALSYSEVAARVGSAPRPVGAACGANRIPLLIPCHRVIGADGIGGFMHSRRGRGIHIKRWLLRHEGVAVD
jgi:methylated-DNA-[protein]-cysteine S-methyltransferase